MLETSQINILHEHIKSTSRHPGKSHQKQFFNYSINREMKLHILAQILKETKRVETLKFHRKHNLENNRKFSS
jgi:7,8-dihydro-6-hydroxymethylpterin-pyrophosphokinase